MITKAYTIKKTGHQENKKVEYSTPLNASKQKRERL